MSGDVNAAPERAVTDSIIKVCCEGLLGKGLLSGFHFVFVFFLRGGVGGGILVRKKKQKKHHL